MCVLGHDMSFFIVRNIQEFGKHRSSCVWREGDKVKGLSRPGIGLGEGGEQNDIGIHPMAQTPNLSL